MKTASTEALTITNAVDSTGDVADAVLEWGADNRAHTKPGDPEAETDLGRKCLAEHGAIWRRWGFRHRVLFCGKCGIMESVKVEP